MESKAQLGRPQSRLDQFGRDGRLFSRGHFDLFSPEAQ
jgi:hypothetical protein